MRSSFFLTRRRLVHGSVTAMVTGAVGRPLWRPLASTDRIPNAVRDAGPAIVDPTFVQTLAMKAVEAAKAAGATYADVRLTRTLEEDFIAQGRMSDALASDNVSDPFTSDRERVGLGVRALVNGYWGFAATPYWTADEATRVANSAVAQAKVNAQGPSRSTTFDQLPVVTGNWRTSVRFDPFRISREEKLDFFRSTIVTALRMAPRVLFSGVPLQDITLSAFFHRQEQALATTDGSYVTQTVYRARGEFSASTTEVDRRTITVSSSGLEDSGRGWEMFAEAKLLDQFPGMLATLGAHRALPNRPAEIGQQAVVCDTTTMAGLLDATLGRATEIDRALGYEANASGTSYLGPDPLTFLGTPVANAMITMTANRSLPTGLATVQWDAEGVTPEDFTLVKAGTLVDYQTTREQAAWLTPWYAKSGTPVRSHGCAAAADASALTMQMAPNLALAPSATGGSFEDLVLGLADGIAIEAGTSTTDFQVKNGAITREKSNATIYHVKGGKRVARVVNAAIIFNAVELWKNITALGGAGSVVHTVGVETKGEPRQETAHTVSAPPGAFKNLSIVDRTRKA